MIEEHEFYLVAVSWNGGQQRNIQVFLNLGCSSERRVEMLAEESRAQAHHCGYHNRKEQFDPQRNSDRNQRKRRSLRDGHIDDLALIKRVGDAGFLTLSAEEQVAVLVRLSRSHEFLLNHGLPVQF